MSHEENPKDIAYKIIGILGILTGVITARFCFDSFFTLSEWIEQGILCTVYALVTFMFIYGGIKLLKFNRVGQYLITAASVISLILIIRVILSLNFNLMKWVEWDAFIFPSALVIYPLVIIYLLVILGFCLFLRQGNENTIIRETYDYFKRRQESIQTILFRKIAAILSILFSLVILIMIIMVVIAINYQISGYSVTFFIMPIPMIITLILYLLGGIRLLLDLSRGKILVIIASVYNLLIILTLVCILMMNKSHYHNGMVCRMDWSHEIRDAILIAIPNSVILLLALLSKSGRNQFNPTIGKENH